MSKVGEIMRDAGPMRRAAGRVMVICVVLVSGGFAYAEQAGPVLNFNIPAGRLIDALDRFGEQSGLQITYDQAVLESKHSDAVSGQMRVPEALNHLLLNSGLSWDYINNKTVVLHLPSGTQPLPPQAATAGRVPAIGHGREHGAAVALGKIEVTASMLRLPAYQSNDFALGMDKSVLETPRTVSIINSEQLDRQGISKVEDILRVIPGTYTTTRYDLQGSINVRSVIGDSFFRGMKRVTLQGHVPTNLAAMDSLEVVEGPPSPLYGMGNMGGYVNMIPKSARNQSGIYLSQMQGYVQATVGSYEKADVEAAVSAPYAMFGLQGGYSGFVMLEDSNDFIEQVGVKQKILQGGTTLNNFIGPFRLESGGQYQNSETSGSYMNRVTQDLINSGRYVRGIPLVSLDTNDDGRIGYLEMHQNSPVAGSVVPGNQPLLQYFAWPVDPMTQQPYAFGHFPAKSGIPQTMLDYLNAHPEADPTGAMRAQGSGGPTPISGQLPVGFVLDPRTTGYGKVDWHRNGAFERQQNADLWLYYFDLVYDSDPNFTAKNQFFLDNLMQTKDSYLPYGEALEMHAIEDKMTVTARVPAALLPGWLQINSAGSFNYRLTRAAITSSGDDFDYRLDVMGANSGQLFPNTSFWNWFDNPSYATGAPATINRRSSYDEFGAGTMLDIDIFKNTNLLLGGRWDGSSGLGVDYLRFNQSTGTSANPGAYFPQRDAKGWSSGKSWSVSLSQQLPLGIRPYVTLAHSARVLDDGNSILHVPTINTSSGFIGESKLKEAGIKASLFDNQLFLATAVYEQTRADIAQPSDPTGSAYRTNTRAKGVEAQFSWNPSKIFDVSGYALFQTAEYILNSQELVEVNARQLGFQDVVDPKTGAVIYPAEAFLYGGRTLMAIPASLLQKYSKRTGDPEKQFGLNMSYKFDYGVGLHAGGTWLSSAYLDRLQSTVLPCSLVINAGLSWDEMRYHFKLNGYNLNNELYFRARSVDASNNMATVLPGRRVEFTAKVDF